MKDGDKPATSVPKIGEMIPARKRALRIAGYTLLAGERLDMGALATQVEVNRTTLYRWFGSKDQLVADALWDLADRTFTRQLAERADHEGPVAPQMVADYARIVIEHPGIRAFLRRDSAYAFQLLTGRNVKYHARLVARILGLLQRDDAAGLLTVSGSVALEDLAYTSARIIEVYAHAFELTGEVPDGESASRVLLALLR